MLDQRRRLWSIIMPTVIQRISFSGLLQILPSASTVPEPERFSLRIRTYKKVYSITFTFTHIHLSLGRRSIQQAQNICIICVRCRPNVFDVGPTLYKDYTTVLCVCWDNLLESASSHLNLLLFTLCCLLKMMWVFYDLGVEIALTPQHV